MIEGACSGVSLRLRSAIPALPDLSSLLPPGFSAAPLEEKPDHEFCIEPTGSLYVGRKGNRRIGPAGSLPAVLSALRKSIQLCVAEHAPDRVFVHAGVVVWNDKAIICPGRSFAGKSTLIWSMVQAGASYYSDEFAVLDSQGFVHPFPVPVTLRRDGYPKRTVAIGSAPIGTRSLPALVLFTEYDPHACWQPRRLSPGLSMIRLLDNAIAARRSPARVMTALSRLAACAPAYNGKRGEPDTVKEWVQELFTKSSKERLSPGITFERMVLREDVRCF